MVYDKLPGANFTWKFNNCSCTTAARAIPCAIFLGICFLFNPPAVYSLFCSGVLDCSPAIHQRRRFPLFGAVSWNWERRLGRRGSFFLHSLSSAQQRCSHSICMHMIGGHFRWVTELTRHATSIIHFSTRILRTLELSIYSHVKMEAKDFHIRCDKELNLHPLIRLILLEPRNDRFPSATYLCAFDIRPQEKGTGKKGMNLISWCGILILNNGLNLSTFQRKIQWPHLFRTHNMDSIFIWNMFRNEPLCVQDAL